MVYFFKYYISVVKFSFITKNELVTFNFYKITQKQI